MKSPYELYYRLEGEEEEDAPGRIGF